MPHRLNYASLLAALEAEGCPEKKQFFPQFFQAHQGGYGEGDRFLGVVVPTIRRVARQYAELPEPELRQALRSPWHECRMAALFILTQRYERAKRDADRQQHCIELYLAHLDYVNNWDLVDCSASKLLGHYVVAHPTSRSELTTLLRSGHLWRQRVAVVATLAQIRTGDFRDLLTFAQMLCSHPHDLIHKAVGWMLREMGKRDPAALRSFLDQSAPQMPRTMLRYAIEKLPPEERRRYMQK
jgi:3-methyladenine DNA glycosylase AlkD